MVICDSTTVYNISVVDTTMCPILPLTTPTSTQSVITATSLSFGIIAVASSSATDHTGAIVGGIIGGLIAVLVLIGAVVFLLRRRRRQQAMVSADKEAVYTPVEVTPTVEVAPTVEVYEDFDEPPQEASLRSESSTGATSGYSVPPAPVGSTSVS